MIKIGAARKINMIKSYKTGLINWGLRKGPDPINGSHPAE